MPPAPMSLARGAALGSVAFPPTRRRSAAVASRPAQAAPPRCFGAPPAGVGAGRPSHAAGPGPAAPRGPLASLVGLFAGRPATRAESTPPAAATGSGGGGPTGSGPTGGGGGGGGDDEWDAVDDDEVIAVKNPGDLPKDMADMAAGTGIRKGAVRKYFLLAGGKAGALAAMMVKASPMIRDRMLADPRFLFKMWVEIGIDAGCATIAELRKRADAFWGEFEYFLSDLIVGVVLDAALVIMIAPPAALAAALSGPAAAAAAAAVAAGGRRAAVARYLTSLPVAVFQKAAAGDSFTVSQRIASWLWKGAQYSVVGSACGLVGQGVGNGLMLVKRKLLPSHTGEETPVPPLLETALVWGLFMAVSSNTRYQVVVGLERLVDSLAITKARPAISAIATVMIRFTNNVIGGEQFIDMARYFGVQ